MIKRTIAYILIMIAGIIMLAHDFVPHHHHDDAEAVELSQTHSPDDHDDLHDDDDHQHHGFPLHEHELGDYLFILRQALVSSPNLCKQHDDDDFCHGYCGIDHFFILASNRLLVYYPTDYTIPFRDKPLGFPISVTSTLGSRAPPLS